MSYVKRQTVHRVYTYGARGQKYVALFNDKATALSFAHMERTDGRDSRYAGRAPFWTKGKRIRRRDWADLQDIRREKKRTKTRRRR